ncbi:MAG TPA: 2Fe-2S iron-sulfur cluster-binding protein [Candidatus Angelobacter sp.]|nr:2Fe-2S iron-sulfur cluster-binding protein [Candidatus Angelobacter sp.]
MPESITLTVDDVSVSVSSGTTVAVAVVMLGKACRKSASGEPRAPLCGMGVCYECRVTIDGVPHCRSCQILCSSGMEVRTEAQ